MVGAKVVTNARKPGSKCFGFVTMSSADEAAKCIQHLHRTELHGKMISVEKVGTLLSLLRVLCPCLVLQDIFCRKTN